MSLLPVCRWFEEEEENWKLAVELNVVRGASQGCIVEGIVDIGGSRYAAEQQSTYSSLFCQYVLTHLVVQVQGRSPLYGRVAFVENMICQNQETIDRFINVLRYEVRDIARTSWGHNVNYEVRLKCIVRAE